MQEFKVQTGSLNDGTRWRLTWNYLEDQLVGIETWVPVLEPGKPTTYIYSCLREPHALDLVQKGSARGPGIND